MNAVKNINNSSKYLLNGSAIFIFTFLFFSNTAMAASGSFTSETWLKWLIYSALGVLLFSIFIIKRAVNVVHENGESIDFGSSFFKSMADNKDLTDIVYFAIVAVGVYCIFHF